MAASNPLSGPLDGVSLIFVAAYLGAVLYMGNLQALGSAVMSDGVGFLEFAIALYLVFLAIAIRGPFGDIAKALVGLAVIGLAISKFTGYRADAFAAFGQGQIGLFALIGKLAGAN